MIPSMGQGCHFASGFSVPSSTDSPGRKSDSMFMLVWEEKKNRAGAAQPLSLCVLGVSPFCSAPAPYRTFHKCLSGAAVTRQRSLFLGHWVQQQEIYQSTNTNCIFRFIRNKDDTMFRSLALEPFRFPSSSVRSSGEKERCCL